MSGHRRRQPATVCNFSSIVSVANISNDFRIFNQSNISIVQFYGVTEVTLFPVGGKVFLQQSSEC